MKKTMELEDIDKLPLRDDYQDIRREDAAEKRPYKYRCDVYYTKSQAHYDREIVYYKFNSYYCDGKLVMDKFIQKFLRAGCYVRMFKWKKNNYLIWDYHPLKDYYEEPM